MYIRATVFLLVFPVKVINLTLLHILRGVSAGPCEMNKTLNSNDALGKTVRQESSSGTFKAWSFLGSCAESADYLGLLSSIVAIHFRLKRHSNRNQ